MLSVPFLKLNLHHFNTLSVRLFLSIPHIHINTCCSTVVMFTTIPPILSVPYLQLLIAWHRYLIGKIAEHELWRCVGSSTKTVKMVFVAASKIESFQVSSRWQDGCFLCIGNDSHQAVVSIVWFICAAPVGCRPISVAFDWTRLVDELNCLQKSGLCDVKGTILVISRSKANRFCVYLLPVL